MSGNGNRKRARKSGADRNTKLMLAMGSRTGSFDPEPPDQWLFALRHSTGKEQALAWIKSKTVARNHHSAYAVDEHKRALKIEHMAAELGWQPQTVRNVLNILREEGRVRIDEEGRLWLCADVPLAHAERDPDAGPETPRQDDWDNFVQSYFSGYLADSVRGLSAEARTPFMAKYRTYAELRPAIFNEAAAAARAITERFENTILGEFGIEKRRLEKRRPQEPQFVRLEVIQESNFVQSLKPDSNGKFVQTATAGSYKPENGSVQTGVSLLTSDTDTDLVGRYVKESVSATEQTYLPTSNPAAAVQELLTRRLSEKLADIPSLELCWEIHTMLTASNVPLIHLDQRIKLRWKKIDSFGFIKHLAQDCVKAKLKQEELRKTDARRYEKQQIEEHQKLIEQLNEQWKSFDEDERDFYRRQMPELLDELEPGNGKAKSRNAHST